MKFLLLILLFSMHTLAESMDNYYSDDLLDAVDQAREKPHHYDYSSTYRYKRTTAQSIQLNQLNLNEMDTTRLEINSQETEAYVNTDTQKNINDHDFKAEDLVNQNSQINDFPTGPNLTVGSYYKTLRGEYRTTGIEHSGTIVSTARP